jgi:hypothetical protein
MKVGDRVILLRNDLPGYPVTTIAQIDDGAGKAQIRFSRPDREGYSYLFWRDLSDIGGVDDGGTATEV